jgi:threonine 3-dehydrogenase
MKALVKKKPIADPKIWYTGLDLIEKEEPNTTPERPVKVEVISGGICGTDVGVYIGKESLGITLMKLKADNVTLGHEFCGKISEVSELNAKEHLAELVLKGNFKNKEITGYISGKNAKDIAAQGDFVSFLNKNFYVAGEMHFTCGKCLQCTHNEEHVCKNTIGKGLHEDGAFATYMVMPANRIVFFEEGEISPKIISFMDALGNGVHTAQSADIRGKTILVTGIGVQGLMSIAVAKAMGAGNIYATDIVPKDRTGVDKLGIALKLGATAAFDVSTEEGRKALKDRIMKDTDNTGVDVVFEMSGGYKAYEQVFELIRMGGTALLLGLPAGKMEVDFSTSIIFKGLIIKGIYGRRIWETWDLMRELLHNGLEKTLLDSGIITAELPLAEYDKGFQMLTKGDAIKILLKP